MFSSNELYLEDIANIAECSLGWEQLKNKSILITGATGLIATFLIDILMYRNKIYNNNIMIYAIGRNREKITARFRDYIGTKYFIFIQHDIQYPIEFDGIVDYIIHVASNTHPIAYASDPINTILLSIIGTENILEFASINKHGTKRILFLSTVEIYGENRGDVEQFTEEYCGYIDCNTLRAGYPEGKRAAEALCQAYLAQKKLDIVIARCCRVYGPTMAKDDSKVIAQFLRNACDNKSVVLKSKGNQQFSFCYVADICSALIVLLLNGENGGAYNIADPTCNITLFQIAELISCYICKDIIFDVPPSLESIGYSKVTKAILNSTKLRNIGWQAKYPAKDGLLRTIEILKNTTIQ